MKKLFSKSLLGAAFAAGALCVSNNANAQYIAEVIGTPAQGLLNDGINSVPAGRSISDNVLGMPQDNDTPGPINFYSLGLGGEIVVRMDGAICNGDGDDLTVFETTWNNTCANYEERAKVWASQDLCTWVELGEICHNGSLDLGCLPWAQYLKIKDVSDLGYTSIGGGDGFDVDGVTALHTGCSIPSETGLARYAANGFMGTPAQGANEIGGAISPFRSVSSRMLGLPLNVYNIFANDATTSNANLNFFSLGNGGSVTLKFPYALVNGEGADLQIYETSFNDRASRSCGNYPEKALVEGSCDGVNFYPLNALVSNGIGGETAGSNLICRDAQVDFGDLQLVNYVRITDVTFAGISNFPGVGDGFDVDAVLGLQNCDYNAAKIDNNVVDNGLEVAENILNLEVYPNPVNEALNVTISRLTKDNISLLITDITGRVVVSEVINNNGTTIFKTYDFSRLESGVYTLSIVSEGYTDVMKVVKN